MFIKNPKLFQIFKYSIYFALAINTAYFFIDDLKASEVVYAGGIGLSELIVAFSASIDTAAWLVLLLILELETFVIPDEKLEGALALSLNIVSFMCWGAIVYAFYGYVATLAVPNGFAPVETLDACALVDVGSYSVATTLDAYDPLTADNCAGLTAPAFLNQELSIIAPPHAFELLRDLAWIDVVNAGIWLLVVFIIELEVYLRSSKLFGTKAFVAYKSFKAFLYVILAVCAALWFLLDAPWDAWDAALWLVAFFFIEMNVLAWQEERAKLRAAGQIE